MDEVDSGAIRTGQRAKVTRRFPSRRLVSRGRVVRVAPYVLDVEAQNRTVEIEVEFDDQEVAARILPGTSADVEVVLEARDQVLRLPTSALLEGNRTLVARTESWSSSPSRSVSATGTGWRSARDCPLSKRW